MGRGLAPPAAKKYGQSTEADQSPSGWLRHDGQCLHGDRVVWIIGELVVVVDPFETHAESIVYAKGHSVDRGEYPAEAAAT